MLQKFIQQLVNNYPNDPSTPSIILSQVRGKWYVSVVRYRAPMGGLKEVLCNHMDVDFDKAIEECYNKWLDILSSE